jgi:hypothetical protein
VQPPASSQPPGAQEPQGTPQQPNYEGGTKATWFHTGDPIKTPGGTWDDPSGRREGAQKSGLPASTPGIATPGDKGLGEWFQVTLPDGRVVVTQKVDKGPGKGPQAKGIGVDVNAALASTLYPGGPKTFPSGKGGFHVQPLGKTLPAGVKPGIQSGTATPQAAYGSEAIPLKGTTALTSLGARAAGGSAYPLTEPGLAGTTGWNEALNKPEIGIDPNQSYLSQKLAEQHELGHAGQKVLGEPGSDFLKERRQQFPEFEVKKHEELRQRLSDQATLDAWRKSKGWSATRSPSYLKERSENQRALSKADPKTLDMLRRVNRWSEMKAEERLLPSLPPKDNFDPRTGKPITSGYGPLPSLPTSDSIAMDRAAMDRAQGGVMQHTVNGEGKITVDVNAPSGTKVNAEGKGIFKEVETNRNIQMPQTSTGGEYAIQ